MSGPTRFVPILFSTLGIALAFLTGVWLSIQHAREDTPVAGLLWPDPPPVVAFNLIDQVGRPLTLEDLRGHWSLVFFGFTNCPDVCPTTLEALARAHEQLKANPLYAARGQVVFVSVDPERDTPELLAQYVRYFSPDFVAASGGAEELKALARSLGVLFMKVEQGENGYTMDHSAGIFFISPDGNLVSVLTPPHHAAEIVARFAAVSAFIESRS